MFILRAIILVLALFMGVFFTIFVLTAIEAKSPKFEDFSIKLKTDTSGLVRNSSITI